MSPLAMVLALLAAAIVMFAFNRPRMDVVAVIMMVALPMTGVISMSEALVGLSDPNIVLIAALFVIGEALVRTGGVEIAAQTLLAVLDGMSPRLVLAVIFAVTGLLGLFISNTATAVLMAPVALAVANALGASPYPFAMTVALAASAAFMTPVSSPVNTLVVGPGNYRFMDFLRIGVPFAIVCLLVSVLLVPLVLPF